MEKAVFKTEECVKKYGAHEETTCFLGSIVGASATPYHELDVHSARQLRIKRMDFLAGYVIILICPCNVDPLTPLFYIVKIGFKGVLFSYFFSKT